MIGAARRPSAADQLESLRDDARQRLAAQRRIEDVRGDLGIERDAAGRRRRPGSVARSAPTRSCFTSWPTSGLPRASSSRRARRDRLGPSRRPPVRRRPRRAERSPRRGRGSSRHTPTPALAARPASGRPSTSSRPIESFGAWVGDRRGERVPRDRRRHGSRTSPAARGRHAPLPRRVRRLPAPRPTAVEVHGQLQSARPAPAASARSRRRPPAVAARCAAPALGPTGDLRRRDRAALRPRAARAVASPRRPARQPLDQRAELVLAEQPQDLVAVVVAELGRVQVELTGRSRTIRTGRATGRRPSPRSGRAASRA